MAVPDDETAEARIRFLALAQHKLNTPLAVINGWSATLLDWDRLDPEEREVGLDAMNRAALELQAQIEDVLDEGRARVLAQWAQPVRMRIDALVADEIGALGFDAARHAVAVDVAGEVWAVADDAALRTALRRVLDNAVTYSPDGGAVHVAVSSTPDRCVIAVRDHGVGLPEDIDVFEPFRRGKNAASLGRGTGLGLHIVRCLMAAMDGEVSATRTDDGTLVELSLPTG